MILPQDIARKYVGVFINDRPDGETSIVDFGKPVYPSNVGIICYKVFPLSVRME